MIKGFNKSIKKKDTRALSPEKAQNRLEGVLQQLRDGQVLVSEKKGQYKKFVSSPDLLVDRVVQALRYGGTVEQIKTAAADTFTALNGKVDWKLGKTAIYEFAGKREVNLTHVAEVFGLEEEGTRVVASA